MLVWSQTRFLWKLIKKLIIFAWYKVIATQCSRLNINGPCSPAKISMDLIIYNKNVFLFVLRHFLITHGTRNWIRVKTSLFWESTIETILMQKLRLIRDLRHVFLILVKLPSGRRTKGFRFEEFGGNLWACQGRSKWSSKAK